MSHQFSAPPAAAACNDAGRKVQHIAHLLVLVEELAGRLPAATGSDGALDRAAMISAAYDDALPIAQKRFDSAAAQVASWAAAAAAALLHAGEGGHCTKAAAERLAEELARAQDKLEAILAS